MSSLNGNVSVLHHNVSAVAKTAFSEEEKPGITQSV
jgi:hypothetical protein